jgi:transcriptional regulator with XRE-family HTH domain
MNDEKIKLKKDQGERLKKIASYFGYDYKKIGEICGLKASQVKDRANGVVEIKLCLANKLENELKISGTWLLTGQGEMKVGAPLSDEWKDKYIACMEDLIEAKKEIERLRGEVSPLKIESGTG